MRTITQEDVHQVLKEHGPLDVHQIADIIIPNMTDSERVLATNKCHARCVALSRYKLVRRAGRNQDKRTVWEASPEVC